MNVQLAGWMILAALSSVPSLSRASETAQARLWCLSLHFQEGSDGLGDTIDMSTVNGAPNGELAPYSGSTYACGFTLTESGTPIPGTIYVNLPPYGDVDHDGWADFFEVSQGASGVTSGTYTTAISDGTVTATWSRNAGSKDGGCIFSLVDNVYGALGDFQFSFELLEYDGPLTYTPGTNVVKGSINLTKAGDPSSVFQGSVQFMKLASDPFNQLTLQAGNLTNAMSQQLVYSTNSFQRDETSWPTNYYGLVSFTDGDPTTPDPDYVSWILSIDDANDANHNGIPDFSDNPQPVTTHPPRLALSLTSTNLQLSISGASGTVCQLFQASALPITGWQLGPSVTVSNDPQLIVLTVPTNPPVFWRVQVQ